jgi:putative ABC transport system substrate-binding protein
MDLRWSGDDPNRMRALARELIGLKPDIILTTSTVATASVQRETRTIPIVFADVGDPVPSGIVAIRSPERERHRLCRLGSLAGRQVA